MRELYPSVKKSTQLGFVHLRFIRISHKFAFFHLELFHPTLWFAVVIVLVLV